MKLTVGTKSLLIGAHWPPHVLAVVLAWKWLHGTWPNRKELAAIALHDIGYIGCPDMDGDLGSEHPELGAMIADHLLGQEYGTLIRGHSKGFAESQGCDLSKLYGPDKVAVAFEPLWFYTLRTSLTGELAEYRSKPHGATPYVLADTITNKEWIRLVRLRMVWAGIGHVIKTVETGKNHE